MIVKQYGFYIDLSRCIGCKACTASCKQWHDIQPGPLRWLRVYQWETGAFPGLELNILPIMCFHCEKPVCIGACPHQALHKEKKYGAVLVNEDKCSGERKCWKACPYGAPQFASDSVGTKMSKCTMCIDRLEQGLKPICVMSCSMRALEFGTIGELQRKYGKLKQPDFLPKDSITSPAVIFKPKDKKKQVVPWNSDRALELWQKRRPDNGEALPDVFNAIGDVIKVKQGIIKADRLVLKARNAEELLFCTMDDE
jgi:anaerobic dimethyl sulfoxide reductase subunit B (iron-sulfur subunit)